MYPLRVFWSAEDEAFIAEAIDLPGCSAVGDTQADAIAEIQDAIVAWIEAARAAGNPVPEPASQQPEHAYSGKFVVRVPRSLHAGLAHQAEHEGLSLNSYVISLLSVNLGQQLGQTNARPRVPWPGPWIVPTGAAIWTGIDAGEVTATTVAATGSGMLTVVNTAGQSAAAHEFTATNPVVQAADPFTPAGSLPNYMRIRPWLQ
jgi:predicted RNase H-like HicB family nuclease